MSQFQRGPLALAFLALLLATGCGSTVIPVSSGTTVSSQSPSFVYLPTNPHVPGGNASLPSSTLGYSVAANGQLTPIPGFPLRGALAGVIAGRFFFTSDADGVHLDTYQIGADGSLTRVQSTTDQGATQCQCSATPILVDRSGTNLYVDVYDSSSGGDYSFGEAYRIDPATGALTYAANDGPIEGGHEGFILQTFSGNDEYGYGSTCSPWGCWIADYRRRKDGSLAAISTLPASGPAPPAGVQLYSSTVVGSDAANRLIAKLSSEDSNLDPMNVPEDLVVYTVRADGSLATTDTSADMTTIPNGSGPVSLSPSGRLVAAAEPNGIQIFDFGGGSTLTLTGAVLPTDLIQQLSWDNDGHLYALSLTQKLYVFNVTAAGASPAPGSPYSVPNAAALYVQQN